jgi:hypothetical protein
MNRADHFRIAEELLERASGDQRQAAASPSATTRASLHGDIRLYLRAAQIHATLAAAGPGVEQEVLAQGKQERPTQAERQAARPPLHPKPVPPRRERP